MTEFPRWQDVRGGIVAGAGGEEAITEARNRNQSYIDGPSSAQPRPHGPRRQGDGPETPLRSWRRQR